MPKLMERAIGNPKSLTEGFPLPKYVSIRKLVSCKRGEHHTVVMPLEKIEQYFSALKTDRDNSFFVALATNPD